jgi:hypothetical protein
MLRDVQVVTPRGNKKIMTTKLCKGERVRYMERAEWGVGRIIAVDSYGTIKVIFEGYEELWIAQGAKYLEKVL